MKEKRDKKKDEALIRKIIENLPQNYWIKGGDPKKFYNELGKHYNPEVYQSTSSETKLRRVEILGAKVYMKYDWKYVIISDNFDEVKKDLETKIKGFSLERIN